MTLDHPTIADIQIFYELGNVYYNKQQDWEELYPHLANYYNFLQEKIPELKFIQGLWEKMALPRMLEFLYP